MISWCYITVYQRLLNFIILVFVDLFVLILHSFNADEKWLYRVF